MGEIELSVMFQIWPSTKCMKEFGGPWRKMNASIFISFSPTPPKSISIVGCKHSHPGILSHPMLPSQKVTLSIIQYSFTILPASQLLFYNTTH